MQHDTSITVVIPTFRAATKLGTIIPVLARSQLRPRFIVVDSDSDDGTATVARELGAEVISIARSTFDHGATREMARKRAGADIVVMMTQDAIPTGPETLDKLVAPLLSGEAQVAYARQLPRAGADIFEAFPRCYNYPAESHVRSIDDVGKYGVYTFFCSDSCAAYLNAALDETGGFRPALTNEDYFAVARLLMKGYRIAYVAEATVVHSHRYTLAEEFRRYFDTGYVRAENPWVNRLVGNAERRGKDFFFRFMKAVAKECPHLLPYAVLHTVVKLAGYRAGFHCLHAPLWLKKYLSSQKYYWESVSDVV